MDVCMVYEKLQRMDAQLEQYHTRPGILDYLKIVLKFETTKKNMFMSVKS